LNDLNYSPTSIDPDSKMITMLPADKFAEFAAAVGTCRKLASRSVCDLQIPAARPKPPPENTVGQGPPVVSW
jgi:hypothetical protein